MNINTFKHDLNNLVEYHKYKYCFENIVYDFNDKYSVLDIDTLSTYYKEYIDIYKHDIDKIKILSGISII